MKQCKHGIDGTESCALCEDSRIVSRQFWLGYASILAGLFVLLYLTDWWLLKDVGIVR